MARVELMQTGGNVGLATRIVEIDDPLRERLRPEPNSTPPPPNSNEARDAERLLIAAQAVVDGMVSLGHDSTAMARLRAALAAQQKGNK